MLRDLPRPAAPGLSGAHRAAFRKWLAMAAGQRVLDLQRYLAAQDADARVLLGLWVRERYYEDLAPADATRTERGSFSAAFRETVLSLLHGKNCGSDRAPYGRPATAALPACTPSA